MQFLRNRIFVGIGALVIILVGIYIYFANFAAQPPTRPLIIFEETIPEEGAVDGQPVVIFAQVSDPEGITEVELWVNGELIATQTNDSTDPSFESSQAFIPSSAGIYLVILKALDGDGYLGESDPFPITVQERSFEPDLDLLGEYTVQEGETSEDIAALFGTTIEDLNALNPDTGEISPGAELIVPARPEGDRAGDPEDGVPLEEDLPVIDPPEPSSPADEAVDAEPDSELWWYALPLPSGFTCFLNPSVCARAIDHEPAPFPGPSDVSATLGEGCAIDVAWMDNSETELGFRVYRITQRPRFAFDLIGLIRRSAGSGSTLNFSDTDPPRGDLFYAVAAYNAGGYSWTPLSAEITSAGCPDSEPAADQALVVEALELETAESFERLYCYASLADSPFDRVPSGAGNFISLEAGEWDIAEHFSGRNRRAVIVPALEPLNVVVECLAWQGEELLNLGRFSNAHTPEEWDGRLQTGRPGSESFEITYRILHSFAYAEDGRRATWPLVDPHLPVPFNLREADAWIRCFESDRACSRVFGPAIEWDYGPISEGPDPIGFDVYRRSGRGTLPELYFSTFYYLSTHSAPLEFNCTLPNFFSVSAIYSADSLGVDTLSGENVHSALSEEMEFPPMCASLEITLDFLWVYGVNDGDPCTIFDDCHNDYEAYGWMSFEAEGPSHSRTTFDGIRVRWNDHCDPGFLSGCAYVAPSYSTLGEATGHNWSAFMLNIGDGWRRGNNVIRLPVGDGDTLNFMLSFRDHDSGSADDLWCGGTGRVVVSEGPHTAEEWLAFNQTLAFDDGNCIVRFTVRGMSRPSD